MKYENMLSTSASNWLRRRLLEIAERRKKKEPSTQEQIEIEALEAKVAEKRSRKPFRERFGMNKKQVRKLMVWAPQRSGRQNLLENRIVALKKQAEKGGPPAQYPQSKSQKKRARVRAHKYGVKARKAVKA